jgi:membrane protein
MEMPWRELLKGLKDKVSKDSVTDMAAAVTYYAFAALFPFLLFLVALATLVIAPPDAEEIVQQLAEVAPGPVTQIMGDRIRELTSGGQSVTLLGFGAVAALWAASGAVTGLIGALNRAYDVVEGRPFWKVRLIALVMTIVSAVLGLAAALVGVAAAPLARHFGGPIGLAIGWLRLPVAGIIMMFLWALLYYLLPDVQQRFKFITPGSVVGVVVWVLASWGFSKYVANFGSYDKTYGSLGGVIVLLLWMWISSLVVLGGAEMNAFIEHRSPEGKRAGAKRLEDAGMEPPMETALARPGEARAEPGHRPVGALFAAAVALAAAFLIGRRAAA